MTNKPETFFCAKCGFMSCAEDLCTHCGAQITQRESARDTEASLEWSRAVTIYRHGYQLIFLRAFQEANTPAKILDRVASYSEGLSDELAAFGAIVKRLADVSEETMDRLRGEAVWNNPSSMGNFENDEEVDSQRRLYVRYLRESLGIVGLESAGDQGLMLGTVIDMIDAALKTAPELDRDDLRALISSGLKLAGLKNEALHS